MVERCNHSTLSGSTLEPRLMIQYCEVCNTMTCLKCKETFFSNARTHRQDWKVGDTTSSSSYIWVEVHEPLKVGLCEHEVDH